VPTDTVRIGSLQCSQFVHYSDWDALRAPEPLHGIVQSVGLILWSCLRPSVFRQQRDDDCVFFVDLSAHRKTTYVIIGCASLVAVPAAAGVVALILWMKRRKRKQAFCGF